MMAACARGGVAETWRSVAINAVLEPLIGSALSSTWDLATRDALVERINKQFVVLGLAPVYTLHNLEAWLSNAAYRWHRAQSRDLPGLRPPQVGGSHCQVTELECVRAPERLPAGGGWRGAELTVPCVARVQASAPPANSALRQQSETPAHAVASSADHRRSRVDDAEKYMQRIEGAFPHKPEV